MSPKSARPASRAGEGRDGDGGVDLGKFLPVLPYGDEGAFGFVGWKFCTPDPDFSVGRVRLVEDMIIKEPVIEVACAPNVKNQNVFIQFPDEEKYTGIGSKLPILTLQIKNIGLDTGVEVRCKTSENKDFTFVATNNTTICKYNSTSLRLLMPMTLKPGWNKLEFDIEEIMGTLGLRFKSAESVKVLASCRLRRIYFSDEKYSDWELPMDLRILPILERQFNAMYDKDEGGDDDNGSGEDSDDDWK